jgi:hypothetical protein
MNIEKSLFYYYFIIILKLYKYYYVYCNMQTNHDKDVLNIIIISITCITITSIYYISKLE